MIYRSNNFSLDTESYGFERDGMEHAIEPQVFDLLVYLMKNRDRVVTRDELLDNLWDGRIVSESALNGRLKMARKSVGDDGKQQRIIKTVHRRGYQFIADVSTNPNFTHGAAWPVSQEDSTHEKPSIAVLPFENLSKESDSDYFADGLTRDINANLCRYRELLVIDSQSAFEYREDHVNTQSFARQLGVRYLASGTIRREDKLVRISAQLVEVATGKLIWGDNLERDYEDVFALEDEVATRIASSLANHIEDESTSSALRKPPESMSAFDCVLRARQYDDSYDQVDNASARALFERAIELDPGYAAAYAHLAYTHVVEADSEWCCARQETLTQAVELSHKALSLDDFDSFAHMVMGWAYMHQEKFDLAEVHLDRAIDCNPNDYDAYCIKSWLLAFTGRAAEVTVCGARALQLNPLAPDDCLKGITTARYTDGDYASALEMLERVKTPDYESEVLRAACLGQLGRQSEAHRAASSAIELGGDFLHRKEWLDLWPFKRSSDREHFLDGLYKAGVLKNAAPSSDELEEPS